MSYIVIGTTFGKMSWCYQSDSMEGTELYSAEHFVATE